MNKLEHRYAEHLTIEQHQGEIEAFRFEPLKLRLADRTFVELDFLVVAKDRVIELHEVKGHWEDDARVKIKVAAELFPWFRFYGVQWRKATGWNMEAFHA